MVRDVVDNSAEGAAAKLSAEHCVQPTDGISEGGGGSVSALIPQLIEMVKEVSKNNPHINAVGWAQLDRDLTKQLIMRACAIVAPDPKGDPHGSSHIGTRFNSYSRSIHGQNRRY